MAYVQYSELLRGAFFYAHSQHKTCALSFIYEAEITPLRVKVRHSSLSCNSSVATELPQNVGGLGSIPSFT